MRITEVVVRFRPRFVSMKSMDKHSNVFAVLAEEYSVLGRNDTTSDLGAKRSKVVEVMSPR